MPIDTSFFGELPQSLVEKVLGLSRDVGENLYKSIKDVQNKKQDIRKQLEDAGLLKKDVDLGYPQIPTTCGIDGSYGAERLLAVDIVACAAVGVEGFVPPQEQNEWEVPDHEVFVDFEQHEPAVTSVIRGLMTQMELKIAKNAPHKVVFLDGSFTSRIIHMQQAVSALRKTNYKKTAKQIQDNFKEFLENLKTVVEADKTDKIWASVPKYTSKRELGLAFGWDHHYDDRALLTSILASGEYTQPRLMELDVAEKQSEADTLKEDDSTKMHLSLPYDDNILFKLKEDALKAIDRLNVMYYRPHSWSPALRIEVPYSIASNNARLAVLLQALKYQCSNPSIMEPYPLYMADRMVKHLSGALPALKQIAFQRMAELHGDGDMTDILFNALSFRTDG